jgi:hypothetical protein
MASTDNTSKRAEANRRNAQRSTGPRSALGKSRSKFNALKHGMSAKLPILPGEDAGAYQSRLDAWTAELQPQGEIDRYLVERAVSVSWQLDRADRAWAARLKADLLCSGSAQALAQGEEVLILGRRLFWDPRGPVELYPQYKASIGDPMRVSWSQDIEDPDEPARLVNRLEGTALGCAWLLDRWNELGDLLEDGLKWQAPDRFKATRLLGKQPVEPIDDLQVRWIHLCTSAMDPECKHEFADLTTELCSVEWKRFLERLEGRDAWREKPEDAEVARAALLELVSEQTERLETLLAAHLERESAVGTDGLGFQDTEAGERLRRYQMACNRTLLRILETLRKRGRETGKPRPTAPAMEQSAAASTIPAVAPDVDGPAIVAASAAPTDDSPALSLLLEEGPPAAEVVETAGPPAGETTPENGHFRELDEAEGRNSKNEPIEPAGTAGRGVLGLLAAFLALVGMAVAGLLWPSSAVSLVKKLPFTVLASPRGMNPSPDRGLTHLPASSRRPPLVPIRISTRR